MRWTTIFGITFVYACSFLAPAFAKNITAKLGETIVIPCMNTSDVDKSDIVSAQWAFDGKLGYDQPVFLLTFPDLFQADEYKGRSSLDEDTFAMALNEISFEDGGKYTCQVFIRSTGELRRASHSISVYAAPFVSVLVEPIVLLSDESTGDRELAVCNAQGASAPIQMKWVDANTNKVIVNDTSREENANADNPELIDSRLPLIVDVTSAEDNERPFLCVVLDADEKEITKSAVISVTTPPEFVSFPEVKSLTVELGKQKNIFCEASGVPTPKVAWYKGSTKLREGMGKAPLSISPQSYAETNQEFKCTAKNNAGKIHNTIQLSVVGKPVVITEDPNKNNTEILELSSDTKEIRLTCVASAFPLPGMSWTIEFNDSNETVKLDSAVTEIEGFFATSNLQLNVEEYSGSIEKIVCSAENSLGIDSQQWIVVLNSPAPTSKPTSGGAGWVIGIVVAVIFILLLVSIIFLIHRKRTSKSEDLVEKGWCASCACRKTKKETLEGQDNDQIKEVSEEEGSKEEKRKLTSAEEKPDANLEVEAQAQQEDETKEEEKEDASETNEEEEKTTKRRKFKINFPSSQCCKKSKKKLKEEESMEEEEEGEDKDQKVLENDADSGKGDTLEKIVDEK